MYKIIECNCDLEQLNKFSQKFAQKAAVGDIIFLKGELGVGKTTFARFFINALFDNLSLQKPQSIKSPSFPIMINYSLLIKCYLSVKFDNSIACDNGILG